MKLKAVALFTIGVGAIYGRNKVSLEGPKVMACADSPSGDMELRMAQGLASSLFARIGVDLEWHDHFGCPSGAVLISMRMATPAALDPGALAYAMPYEGTHIVVFWDRIEAMMRPGHRAPLLAYVEAHEITHILEAISRHSTTGIMKAHWNEKDYGQMTGSKLGFAAADVDLIYAGLAHYEARSATHIPVHEGENEKAACSR